ncbi:FeoB small GTPase domain-containing protein [Streptomyces sp. MK7]|uniref:FeoB small GTPase domain-containing protein n=1 Tax=Streptomyces sp. MK7 TaxID=3067635 RepID=UPI00292CD58F|nr:FeoB small GTPase domain-containing protein [Streptomyces sp. MK7]
MSTGCHDADGAPATLTGAPRIALIGAPNSGKTSVFNGLTGRRAKTGNYPGVATLWQVAAAEDPEQPAQALRTMTYPDGPRAGERVFTAPAIAALLVYFVYALQCMATVAVLRRESGGRRWPAVAFGYLTALAWIMAYLARTAVVLLGG